MKVVVLGAGVVGTATAYYLARAGHEVEVIERQSGPALETSFANAGEISPGYASPWAAPGIPQKAIRWLLMRHAPLILRPEFDLEMVAWLVAMLGNSTSRRYVVNKSRLGRLAEYSRLCLMALRTETGISYDERMQGTLQLFRTQAQLDGAAKDIKVLKAEGVPFEVLDRAGCIAVEPGLAGADDPFVGGLRLPNDETGDCFKFTNRLAAMASELGVRFRFDTQVQGLDHSGGKVTGVRTDKGLVTADQYVVALGSFSARLVRPLGLGLPVYPVKGYSITAPIIDPDRAPVSTLLDETYKVAITRLGDRIRVGGMAEISGYNNALPERRRQTLIRSVGSLFPGAGDLEAASFWSGLRPMTPDSTPVVGASPVEGMWFNTGHGTLGWTMACGSGQVISDLISGRAPAIETKDLSIARYGY